VQTAAFFDVDGTLTRVRVWKGMLEYFQERRLRRGTHLLYMLLHYPTYVLRKLGLMSEAAFRRPWAADMAWYFRDETPEGCQDIWNWITDQYLPGNWRDDVREILESHLAAGEAVVLVSSGPLPLIQHIAHHLGTDHAVGTDLETRDGRYTGRSLKPICIDTYKASMAQDYLQKNSFNIDLTGSHSYADSTSDLPILEMVGHPVAVYPDIDLLKIAKMRKWKILPAQV
jgi:HAD superfamily hydrolase (TIGR01490 family)